MHGCHIFALKLTLGSLGRSYVTTIMLHVFLCIRVEVLFYKNVECLVKWCVVPGRSSSSHAFLMIRFSSGWQELTSVVVVYF